MTNLRAQFALLTVILALLQASPALPAAETAYERSCAELAAKSGREPEHDRLWRLFDIYWKYQMTEYPEWATAVGYPGQNGRWTDMSLAAIARRKRELDAPLGALRSIDRSKLDQEDQLNYDLLKYRLEMEIEGRRFPDELLPVNQLQGVQQSAATILMDNPTATVRDYEDILSRLRGVPTVIDQTILLMKEGLARGITPPKPVLGEVPQQIKNQMPDDPLKSPLFEPFKKFPSTITAAEQERLRNTAAGIIKEQIVPAYGKLLNFFVSEYLPGCRESLSITDLPDGKAWYAHRVRERTTTSLTPQQIHDIGLSEVKRLRAEMDAVIAQTGFKGNFQQFCHYLRSDPQFFFNDAQTLLMAYRDIAKRIDPELMRQFGTLPRLQYGIKPVPAFCEKSWPTAYYQGGTLKAGRPGIFFANTYDLRSRPKWEMEALTLHEAVPGHHLQIALGQELDNVPEFRKHGEFTAYTEGWGLYAESLGTELDMYKDPYSRFGQLTYDMWRAIRLVLDTGIHSLGWSTQQAIDFFKENCAKTPHDIEVEVDRYIVWPGQALAYKIGQLAIRDLKDQARRELGDRYDVRAFHDAILSMGAVPLDVLKSQMERWIAAQRVAQR
ncbi:MAG TPA: DUF885 domain-containing protein [Candidatus Obscuribacterales bacterium]